MNVDVYRSLIDFDAEKRKAEFEAVIKERTVLDWRLNVCQIADGYEFRDPQGRVVDWEKERVFFQPTVGYWTRKKVPVSLHRGPL